MVAGTKTIEQLKLRIMSQQIKFILNTQVIAIDRAQKQIITSDNSKLLYKQLIIATGVRPKLPSISSMRTNGVFTFHTLEDALAIHAWLQNKKVRSAVIIGGGLTGIECADMLHRFGIAVTIVEQQERILNNQLPAVGAQFLAAHMQTLGITLLYKRTVREIIETDVVLDDGQKINADLIIIATGVQPNSEIAHEAGLACHNRHILVNTHMQTPDPDVYAVGDVVAIQDRDIITMPMYTWADAVQKGAIAAHTITDRQPPTRIKSIVHSSFFGLQFQAFGTAIVADTIVEKVKPDEYMQLTYKDNIPVTGYYLGNSFENSAQLRRMIFQPIALTHR